MDIWRYIWRIISPWIVIGPALQVSHNLADSLDWPRRLNDVKIRRWLSHMATHVTHMKHSCLTIHVQITFIWKWKVINALLRAMFGQVKMYWQSEFVHLTAALLWRLQCFRLSKGSPQQLQQGPKHSDPQRKLMSLTVYVLLEYQPMTLTYCLYILFCSYAAYLQHKDWTSVSYFFVWSACNMIYLNVHVLIQLYGQCLTNYICYFASHTEQSLNVNLSIAMSMASCNNLRA